MLSNATIDAFVQRDTQVVANALIGSSLLGTEVGDRVLAAVRNHPERFDALRRHLTERGAWDIAA